MKITNVNFNAQGGREGKPTGLIEFHIGGTAPEGEIDFLSVFELVTGYRKEDLSVEDLSVEEQSEDGQFNEAMASGDTSDGYYGETQEPEDEGYTDGPEEVDPEPMAAGTRRTKVEMTLWKEWKERERARSDARDSTEASEGGSEDQGDDPGDGDGEGSEAPAPRTRRVPGSDVPVGGDSSPQPRRRPGTQVPAEDGKPAVQQSAEDAEQPAPGPRRRKGVDGGSVRVPDSGGAGETSEAISDTFLTKAASEASAVLTPRVVKYLAGTFEVANLRDMPQASRLMFLTKLTSLVNAAEAA